MHIGPNINLNARWLAGDGLSQRHGEALLQLLLQKSVAATDALAFSAEIDDVLAQAEADAATVEEMERMLGALPELNDPAVGRTPIPRLDEAAIRAAGLRSRLVLQIHDELLVEAPADEVGQVSKIVRDAMVGAYALDPPLVVAVGVGDTWLQAKS